MASLASGLFSLIIIGTLVWNIIFLTKHKIEVDPCVACEECVDDPGDGDTLRAFEDTTPPNEDTEPSWDTLTLVLFILNITSAVLMLFVGYKASTSGGTSDSVMPAPAQAQQAPQAYAQQAPSRPPMQPAQAQAPRPPAPTYTQTPQAQPQRYY